MVKNWYVLRTRAQSDHLAARNLQKQRFEVFFPKVGVPRAGSIQDIVPLFPGYLFIRLESDDDIWPRVKLVPGVLDWVRLDGSIPSVPDAVVYELMQRVETIDHGGGLWTRFKKGQVVRVVSGKMESPARVVEEPQSPESRVRVLLDFMGRQVRSEVPWHAIKAIDADSHTYGAQRPRRTRGRGRWIRGFRPVSALSS